jgi:hypothetical protein
MVAFDPTTIETLQFIGAIAGGIFTFFAAIFGATWRISRHMSKYQERFETLERNNAQTSESIVKLGDKFIHHLKSLYASNQELTKTITVFGVKLDEREKDYLRLEGQIDGARKNILELTGGIRETKASLDALWLTLQRLFPDKVPGRLSDK